MTPDDALRSWSFDPGVLIALAVCGALYARGQRRTARPSTGRGIAFWSGMFVVTVALVSPLDEASVALLSAHMVQHLLLGLVAPLLLVAGAPLRTMQRGLPPAMQAGAKAWRRALRPARLRRHLMLLAFIGVALHVGSFWVWHIPVLYDSAVEHGSLHALEHATLLAGGLVFWGALGRARWHQSTGVAVLALFVAALGSGALAALLTLAPRSLYDAHVATTAPWHVTPLEDQQLAGALMWVPGGLVYAVAATLLFIRWLEAGPARSWPSPAPPATRPQSPTVGGVP